MLRIVSRVSLLAGGLSILAGCPNRDVSAVNPNQSKEEQKEVPVSLNRDIDILWVIDNSGSMRQEQGSLAANFPKFIDVLDGIEGGRPNLHMGIVSSDVGTFGYNNDKCGSGYGDNGILQVDGESGCPALTDGKRFINDVVVDEQAGTRQTNYNGTLQDQFSCMAQLGTGGCGFEQHMESMKRGLSNKAENAGFLRDSAFLAIIFIQDEDDCSASDPKMFDNSSSLNSEDSSLGALASYRCTHFGVVCDPDDDSLGAHTNCMPRDDSPYVAKVSDYVDFVKNLKSDPGKVLTAAITGPREPFYVGRDPTKNNQLYLEPSCVVCPDGTTTSPPDAPACSVSTSDTSGALTNPAPAIRLGAFLDAFPARSTFQNMCTYNPQAQDLDFAGALVQIATLLRKVVGSPCIDGDLADKDPSTPGVQPECEVADVQNLNQDNEVQFPIQECNGSMSNTPCYYFQTNTDQCGSTPTQLTINIQRSEPPPDNTTVVARCLVN